MDVCYGSLESSMQAIFPNRPSMDPQSMKMAFMRCAEAPVLTSTEVPKERRPMLATLLKKGNKPLHDTIHPMFNKKRWAIHLTGSQHIALHPALQIASHLLEQGPVLDCFAHILYADLKSTPEKVYPEKAYLVANEATHHPSARNAVQRVFTYFATMGNLLFSFDTCDCQKTGMNTHGMAVTNPVRWTNGYGQTCIDQFHSPHIQLNENYLTMLMETKAADLEVIQLSIAITLLHELAHMLWVYRARYVDTFVTAGGRLWQDEPAYDFQDTTSDLGFALEEIIFGGIFELQDHGKQVLPYYDAGLVSSRCSDEQSRVIVPAWWIHMWFNGALYESDVFETSLRAAQLFLPGLWGCEWHFRYQERSKTWQLYSKRGMEGAPFTWDDDDSFLQRKSVGAAVEGVAITPCHTIQEAEPRKLEPTSFFSGEVQKELDSRMQKLEIAWFPGEEKKIGKTCERQGRGSSECDLFPWCYADRARDRGADAAQNCVV